MKHVMFVCKKNSRRSQMAEGYLRTLSKGDIAVTSSGLEASHVDPITLAVMDEVGIDIRQQTSKALHQFNPDDFDAVVSLCGCGIDLPHEWLTRGFFEDWQLDDPEGEGLTTFQRVRDQIQQRVMQLIQTLAD